MQKVALIVAGGIGERMNSTIPKQFLLLKGIPVLMRVPFPPATIKAIFCIL